MTTDLKTVKANDTLRIINVLNDAVHTAVVTKAGAAHLLCAIEGQPDVRIARATGMQVAVKPQFAVCGVVADLTGALHDARYTVTDVQVTDDVQAQVAAVFGAGTTVRVQIVARDGKVMDSVAQVTQPATGYSEDFSGDADTDALLRHIIDSRKATGEDPVQPAPAAPPAYVLTDADKALVGRVAKVNADLRAKNPDPSPFDAAYFAKTKSLMKVAGDNAAHLNALCDACAVEGNRMLSIAPAAPQQAPQAPAPVAAAPAVTDPPAAPAAPVTAPQQGTDGDAPKAPKAKRGTKRAAITDADVEGAKAVIRTVVATAPTTTDDPPAQAPAAAPVQPAVAAAQAVSDDGLAGLHPLLTQYDAAVALADRGGMTGDVRDAFSAFRGALLTHLNTAFVQAPATPAKGNRATRRAQATTTPKAPRSSAPKSSVSDLSPTWVRVAGIIGRHAAKFVGGTGPVSADDVRATEHPYIVRVPVASRDIVVAEAARIATDLRANGAAPAAPAAKPAKAPKGATPKARKVVAAGGTVRINADALNADELTGAFTVVKVSGSRVFARTAAGDEVRLPLADVTAC